MGNRYEIAEQNGMSREFVDWFFDNKKAGCGNVWFMMMAAMWEGWKGNADMQERQSVGHVDEQSLPGIQSAPELNSLQNNAGSVPVTLTANELSAILSWMTPPYITSGTHTDEFNELRNKVFYALRDAKNDEPVIEAYKLPDGWVAVPVDPTEAMLNAWLSEVANWRGHAAGYKAMLAAAPQYEVNPAQKKVDRCGVCTEGARGGCGTCIFNGNF